MRNQGRPVPIVAFYSVQGGVGKSTLARKFAELITIAPIRDGRRPNVLLIDLDVDSSGLTFRLAHRMRHAARTIHELIAERNVAAASAIAVTASASLSGRQVQHRGQLFLVPAAPPEAKGIFDTIAAIERPELLSLLRDLIRGLVMQYDISCVVLDCAPGAYPYSAAAAALADLPLLIGRNESATYDQIGVLPERFREMFPEFQPAKQRVIINSVSVKDLYFDRAKQYAVFDYIPLISDVIHEAEGLQLTDSFRMLLFEKYMVDIIKQVFVGRGDLIPELPEVMGQEWIDTLGKLARCDSAPKLKRWRMLGKLRWPGPALAVAGAALLLAPRFVDDAPKWFTNAGIVSIVAGALLAVAGWWAHSERHRLLAVARELVLNGPEHVLRRLQQGASHRKALEEMRKLAATVPDELPVGALPAPVGSGA